MGKCFAIGGIFAIMCCVGLFFVDGVYAEDSIARPDYTMGHDGSDKVVIAKVNGVDITMTSLIRKMYDLAQKKYGKKEISPLVARKISGDAVEALVMEELAYQKSYAVVGELPPGMLENSVAAFKKKLGGTKAFENFLKREGLTESSYTLRARRALTLQLFFKREINDKLQVTDEEINATYQDAKGEYFVREEEVQVTDIVLFFDPKDPQTNAKVEGFRARVTDEYGGDPFKVPQDGSFVVRKNIKLDKIASKKRYETAKKLGEGVLSHSINVDGTLHLVQLTGYKSAVSKKLEDVRGYLTKEIKKRKRQGMVKQWIATLKEGADIELYDLTR